jgi:hypothetical protein
MCQALEDFALKRVEMIGFRGCAKSTLASLALPLWVALEHPELYPFIILLADTRGHAASVQYELRNNDLILRDYGHLKYKKIDDPRLEPTLESAEDWQAMNCVLDNGMLELPYLYAFRCYAAGSGNTAGCPWRLRHTGQLPR